MITYHYELIFGASWVANTGAVNANSHHEARAKIFQKLGLDDPDPEKWIETNDTPARFRIYLTEATAGVDSERVEFWQVPTLFG